MSGSEYKLGVRLARGGMAEVFLAIQQGLAGFEKLVVIKRILPHLGDEGQFVQMFLDEARLAASLRHPGIVTLVDLHRDDDTFFVVMEYLRGEDLRRLLRKHRNGELRIPVSLSCFIVARVAEALHFAHNITDAEGNPLGLVHRDVAPSNIIASYDGQVKLIDFGVAKATAHLTYTRPGTVKGKYAYIAPEQARGHKVDARADVFGLGVVLHELLTGRRLFKGDNPVSVLNTVLSAPIEPPSQFNEEVPASLDAVVMAALERDPEQRTPDAASLRDELNDVLRELGTTVTQKDFGDWMRHHLAEELEARQRLEREAVQAARTHDAAPEDRSSRLPEAAKTPSSAGSYSSPGSEPRSPGAASPGDAGSASGSTPSSGSGRISRLSSGSLRSASTQRPHRRAGSAKPSRRRLLWVAVGTLLALGLAASAFALGRLMSAPRTEDRSSADPSKEVRP